MMRRWKIAVLFVLLFVTSGFAQSGQALYLDGDGDWMVVPGPWELMGLTNMTAEVWVKIQEFQWNAGILALGDRSSERFALMHTAYGLREEGNPVEGVLEWEFDWSGGWHPTFATKLEQGRFQHVAVTYDSSICRLYVDGLFAEERAYDSPRNGGEYYNLYIGNQIGSHPEFHKGLIDEVRIWDYARTKEEIQADMSRSLTGEEQGLVGYWDFNGTTQEGLVPDLSSSANHGVLVGNARLVQWDVEMPITLVRPVMWGALKSQRSP